VYVGMAVTSHNTEGSPSTAVFDQMSVGPADPSEVISVAQGSGDGLSATYYGNHHLYGTPLISRVDRHVDFDFWYLPRPGPGSTVGVLDTNLCMALLGKPESDEFGVRWVGEVQAQFTEPYTFYTKSDDGVRVWLNEQLIIDDWRCHGPEEKASTTVNLVAGQKYLLVVEYFQNYGEAQVSLAWSSPSTPERVVPHSQLFSQPTDADGNGLPDLWEQHYFGHTGVDPNADPDGDGLSNLQEYQRHTDPTNPQTWGVPDLLGHGSVGDWDTVGDAGYSNGVFTITSTGADIWKQADSFHYVYQALGTNGQMVARVAGIQGTNRFVKAGLMVRETLDVDSRNAMMLVTSNQGTYFQWREMSGSISEQTLGSRTILAPCWVKIVRSGDWVGGYSSQDGANWTLTGWEVFRGLAPAVYVGMAVTSHNTEGSPSTAVFDQMSVGPADPSEVINVAQGSGDGLSASYRNDPLLYLPGITNRVDAELNLDWFHGPAIKGLNPDSYGVSWSGELQAQFTEPYTFSVDTRQEDWVRVWINEQLIVDGWRVWHPEGELKGAPLNLTAGQHYLVRVEMYNKLGKGKAILRWSSPSMSERIIAQSQLYSQPKDSDGNGLPDIWEQIYFGRIGVDPNADPDGDGLSNLQEYKFHTNPLKADTDNDGMPDAWEIAHGLDPQFNDANLDYDNSGLNNLQKDQYGLYPFNMDINGDSLPDSLEEEYLGTGSSLICTNQVTVVSSVNGAQATNFLGHWQTDGNDIYCLDRRGGLDFILSTADADKYVLNLIGTQNQINQWVAGFKLLLDIDGQSLGHYILNAGYGTNGTVELVLPYLQPGTHTLHVFWDGVASFSSLRLKQVKLLSVSGATNQNGLKGWVQRMVRDQSGLDNTNAIIGSYTAPVCLEGRDPYPVMMQMTNGQTNALSPVATTDGRWYVNVPFLGNTQTVFQASYQNGAVTQTRSLRWLQVNLLTATNLTIRLGDALLFNATPISSSNGSVRIVVGTNAFTSSTSRPVPYRFTTPGVYTVTGTYTSLAGSSQSGSIAVDVVQENLTNVQPAAWTGMERALDLTNLAPEVLLQADSRLTCLIAGTNANGAVTLNLGTFANEKRSIIARLGTNGPVVGSTQVQGFDVWSGNQAYTRIIQYYPDGSQLVEMLVISSPVETNVVFEVQAIAGGVMFEDGTTVKTLTATNFDALGQCPVRFIRPASAATSVCNSIKAYQGNYQIGYRH